MIWGLIMKFAEDYTIGQIFEIRTHEITASQIISFAEQFDPQPYHLSEEAGCQSPFKGLIASGWHTASIWMNLYVKAMLKDAAVFGSPGIDDLRWHRPVRPRDLLIGQVKILDILPPNSKNGISIIRKEGTLRRGDEPKPLMSLIINSRFGSKTFNSTT